MPSSTPSELLNRPALTIGEAATVLGVSTATARRLVAAGRMPAVRLTARTVRIPTRALVELLDATTAGGEA